MKARNPKTIQDQIDQAACGTSRKLYRINGAEFLLQVTPKGVKSWCYRYTLNNKTRVMGLGPVHRISFDEATSWMTALTRWPSVTTRRQSKP